MAVFSFVLFLHALCARAQDVEGLVRARDALRAGDTDEAAARAREVIAANAGKDRAQVLGDAYVVLGLALMRSGDPQGALEAFDAALASDGQSTSDRTVIGFNRGVCLFELERYADAERAFLAVADQAQGTLAAMAVLNAGFAAYEAGALEQARAHAARVAQLDREGELADELAELEADLSAEVQDDEDLAVARYEAGVAAYEGGAWSIARTELAAAHTLGLDVDRDAAALAYLDLLSGGLRRSGRGVSYALTLGVGYDSNVTQTGLGDGNALLGLQSTAEADGFGRAVLDLGYGLALSEPVFVRVDYSVEQLVHGKRTLDVMNAQDHDLLLALEHRLTQIVRIEGSLIGALSFMGLRELRALSWSGGGAAKLGFDYGDGFATEVGLLVLGTDALAAELPFLAGHRIEVELAQEYRQRGLSIGGALSYRVERLGTQTFQTAPPQEVCPDCTGVTAIPLAYDGPAIALWASKRLLPWLRCGARARIDWRNHRDPTGFVISTPFGREFEGTVRTQQDTRLSAGLSFTAELIGPLEAQLSYGIVKGVSNIDNTRGGDHALDYSNLNFTRHVLELSLSASD